MKEESCVRSDIKFYLCLHFHCIHNIFTKFYITSYTTFLFHDYFSLLNTYKDTNDDHLNQQIIIYHLFIYSNLIVTGEL